MTSLQCKLLSPCSTVSIGKGEKKTHKVQFMCKKVKIIIRIYLYLLQQNFRNYVLYQSQSYELINE